MVIYSLADEESPPLELPANIGSLRQFRKWVFSDSFPETGRIDFLSGRIEIDMAADDLFSHNLSKTAVTSSIHAFVKSKRDGWLFSDGARVTCLETDLSVEPDMIYVSQESCDLGTVSFRRSKSESHQGYAEIVGPPDLVVEIVSDSSVRKDTQLLPEAYFHAGIKEFWLIDCRPDQIRFDLFTRGRHKYKLAKATEDGYRRSSVLKAYVRLTRQLAGSEMWRYDFDILEKA